MRTKVIRKSDIVIVSIIIAITLVMVSFMTLFSNKGNTVEIKVGSLIYKTVPLNTNQEVNIKDTNVIVVKNGKVSMKSATCKDKLCVNHKAISQVGESIVCLPNKVVVSIINGTKEHNNFEVW